MKRTQAQLEFDSAKHGWAFCNRGMLEGILIRLRVLVQALPASDRRHGILAQIEAALERMESAR